MKRLFSGSHTHSTNPNSSIHNTGTSHHRLSHRAGSNDDARKAAIKSLVDGPVPADPLAFVQAAYAPIFTHNTKHELYTLEDIKLYHAPKYLSDDFVHQINTTKMDLPTFLEGIEHLRSRYKSSGLRHTVGVVDEAEHQSIQEACVYVQTDLAVLPVDAEEEIKAKSHSIINIRNGKIVSDVFVADFSPLRAESINLACVVS